MNSSSTKCYEKNKQYFSTSFTTTTIVFIYFFIKKKNNVRKCFSSVCGNFSQDFSFYHFRNLKFVKLKKKQNNLKTLKRKNL